MYVYMYVYIYMQWVSLTCYEGLLQARTPSLSGSLSLSLSSHTRTHTHTHTTIHAHNANMKRQPLKELPPEGQPFQDKFLVQACQTDKDTDDAKTIFENKGKDDIIDQKLLVSATLFRYLFLPLICLSIPLPCVCLLHALLTPALSV